MVQATSASQLSPLFTYRTHVATDMMDIKLPTLRSANPLAYFVTIRTHRHRHHTSHPILSNYPTLLTLAYIYFQPFNPLKEKS